MLRDTTELSLLLDAVDIETHNLYDAIDCLCVDPDEDLEPTADDEPDDWDEDDDPEEEDDFAEDDDGFPVVHEKWRVRGAELINFSLGGKTYKTDCKDVMGILRRHLQRSFYV